jgi:class 3 adenylate cyclase
MVVSRRVQTLLFTDIVGSTDRLRDLGDASWAALLARHYEVIRAVLSGHGGREVDTAGDGLLARFDAPAVALRAAVAAVAAVKPLGIEIRAGLHASEVQLHGDGMTGVGVHLAARVMAEADPGQVLVSATIRELMAGSGLGFVDLGVRKLKGFPERRRLYALDPATVRGSEAQPEAQALAVGTQGTNVVPFPGLRLVDREDGYVGREEPPGRSEEPSDRPPASVRTRPTRRRWVLATVMLLVVTIGVLGAWTSRPRKKEARISTLEVLLADFRPLGFTSPEQFENIDLTSLSRSRLDDTHKRWLQEAGFRRALVVKFRHPKEGRILELRIYEVRASTAAQRLQEKFSICSTIKSTRTFKVPDVIGSDGTQCDLKEGPTQEVTFTRGPRLFKLKLWGRSRPKSRELILNAAHVEAAVAR